MDKNKIIIFTQKGCVYCDNVKEKFTEEKIEYIEKTAEENKSNWEDIIRFTGVPMTPTIVYKDEYLVPGRDFGNPKQLAEIIKNTKTSKFSLSKRIDQKIKTLNYNMGMAFGRTDKILREIELQLRKITEDNNAE